MVWDCPLPNATGFQTWTPQMVEHMHRLPIKFPQVNMNFTGIGKCPVLGILDITFKYVLEIIAYSKLVGWCEQLYRTFTNCCFKTPIFGPNFPNNRTFPDNAGLCQYSNHGNFSIPIMASMPDPKGLIFWFQYSIPNCFSIPILQFCHGNRNIPILQACLIQTIGLIQRISPKLPLWPSLRSATRLFRVSGTNNNNNNNNNNNDSNNRCSDRLD